MKTIGSETLVPKIVNCINRDCNQKIIRVQVFDFNKYIFLYFDEETRERIDYCPQCGTLLHKRGQEEPAEFMRNEDHMSCFGPDYWEELCV